MGNQLSLVAFSFLPYLERLQQLKLDKWWQDKPAIDAWLRRFKETPAYQTGMKEWHNQHYIGLMEAKGAEASPTIDELISVL